MTTVPSLYVLDSFAMLAFFQAEPGAVRVRTLLENARDEQVRLLMSVANMGEVIYKTIHKVGPDRADEVAGLLLTEYRIEFIDVDQDLALRAAQIKGSFAMSYADCMAAALGIRMKATVVTGDPEFHEVEGFVDIEWLPQSA